MRARMVTIMLRVVFAFGLNSLADVPFIRPFSRTYWTASKYQLFLETSLNLDASGFAVSSFGLLGLEGVTGVTGVTGLDAAVMVPVRLTLASA